MLFVSVFVSMLGMMILIISLCVRPHFSVLKISPSPVLTPVTAQLLMSTCWSLNSRYRVCGEPFGHSPVQPSTPTSPSTHPSPINWRDQRGVRAGGGREGDITQVGWGWFSVNRQWKFKSSDLFLGTINCEFMKSHAGKTWGLGL